MSNSPPKKLRRGLFSKLWLTVTDDDLTGIFGGLAFLLLVGGLALVKGSIWVALGGLLMISAVLVAATYVIGVGVITFDEHEIRKVKSRALVWAKMADTSEERTHRFDTIQQWEAGLIGAMAAVGVSNQDFISNSGSSIDLFDTHNNMSAFPADSWSDIGGIYFSRPMVNIDGTPMIGDVDMNGNPYGVTTDHFPHSMDACHGTSMDYGSNCDTWASHDYGSGSPDPTSM